MVRMTAAFAAAIIVSASFAESAFAAAKHPSRAQLEAGWRSSTYSLNDPGSVSPAMYEGDGGLGIVGFHQHRYNHSGDGDANAHLHVEAKSDGDRLRGQSTTYDYCTATDSWSCEWKTGWYVTDGCWVGCRYVEVRADFHFRYSLPFGWGSHNQTICTWGRLYANGDFVSLC